MPQIRADRVLEVSTVEGTGDITLAGAVVGYRAFSSVLSNGDTAYYMIQAVTSVGAPSGPWELGLGTYVAATNRLQRSPILSSNGNALVSFAGGQKQIWLAYTAADYAALVAADAALVAADASEASTRAAADTTLNNRITSEVSTLNNTITQQLTTTETITSSLTGGSGWLLPTGAKSVHVICIGGGGGGGGGGKSVNSTNDGTTGTGAAGGGRIEATFPASAIGTPGTTRVNITIGAGGSSGNGATTAGALGTDGTDGGTSSFGTLLYAPGGKASVGGLVPYGGFQWDGTAAGRFVPFNGAQGGIQNTTATIYTGGAATGGGGGGGNSYGGTGFAGNTGSPIYLRSDLTIGADGAGGTTTTTADSTAGAGGAGTSRSGSGYCGGGGGGGGNQRATTGTTGIGGAGGPGGLPGGGGGGGGPARSTSTRGGNGGAGGRGEVIVTVYY